MLEQIIKDIKKALARAGAPEPIELTIPPNPALGDFAFPCFGLAKEMKKNPAAVAKEIKSKVESRKSKVVERVEALGPYVNFYLNAGQVAKTVTKEVKKEAEEFGSNKSGRGKKILIEYPSNNSHKEFHIGHFRNACIGNTLVQLCQKSGYKVFPVNYLNDFGAHVARCLWGLEKFHGDETPPENKQKWLGDIYAEASRYLKERPEAGLEVAELQKKLEAKDKKVWPLFMETRQWSIDKFEELFKELGVKHVATFFEKDLKKDGQKIADELLKKGIAKVGEGGAIIIDLSPYKLDVALLRKSNGAGLYLTSDLPLAKEKFKKFKVNESIVITAQEQNFYFKQLYKVLELMGIKKKLTHIGYGLVNLPEGKMSSRTGQVVLYEDLRDLVYGKMLEETTTRHPDWESDKIAEVARGLTLAALKFDMLKHEAAKNIVFDIKEATSVEGFSGPYVLYVVARINSLLKKSKNLRTRASTVRGSQEIKKSNVEFNLLTAPEEKKLALSMGEFGAVVQKALEQYNPSVIARFAFDLAQAYNDFYNKHSVLSAEFAELVNARLALSVAVRQVLKNALSILTIPAVEEM